MVKGGGGHRPPGWSPPIRGQLGRVPRRVKFILSAVRLTATAGNKFNSKTQQFRGPPVCRSPSKGIFPVPVQTCQTECPQDTADIGGGDAAWDHPDDLLFCLPGSAAVTLQDNDESNLLIIKDFKFNIPANHTIDSIKVMWKGRCEPDDDMHTAAMFITRNGVSQVPGSGNAGLNPDYTTTLTDYESGGPPLWNVGWTPAEINSANFGIGIQVDASADDTTFFLSQVKIEVCHTGSEWKAWPGGQSDTSLNPTESFTSADFGFTGNVDWDVGQGATDAVIVETGTTTATNRSSITVRYDTKSPTSGEGDTVRVDATQDAVTETKKRTVFSVSWSLKFAGNLHADDNLRFEDGTGTDTAKCEFNWDGERGAEEIAAKMEATCSFSPTGINWSARGVTFKFSADGGGAKFNFRLHRRRIWTVVGQSNTESNRNILRNDADWVYDGNSDPFDAQYPTTMKPDRAFRQDSPGFDADDFKQVGFRLDLREIAEWHDGAAWRQISVSSQGEWYTNATAVLPDGSKGGTNNHGRAAPRTFPIRARPRTRELTRPWPVKQWSPWTDRAARMPTTTY